MKPQTLSSKKAVNNTKAEKIRPPFECIALLLQGGGALGSYQAGVYEALADAGVEPDWVAGISIGSINSAIIAGNVPDERVVKLKGFWDTITANPWLDWATMSDHLTPRGDTARQLYNSMSAGFAMAYGAAHFFSPRTPVPFFHPNGFIEATSFYDTIALKATLEQFVDFDRLNKGPMRFSAGAVNVRTGNFSYFDNTLQTIRADHILASSSLPPGFPATEIDGEFYWDGGLVSNTPLQWVVDDKNRRDTLAFQIDLWPAEGDFPLNLSEVTTRQKEIQYSSRTRAGTDHFKRIQVIRGALANHLAQLPPALQGSEEVRLLKEAAGHNVYNIVHLIYRSRQYETHYKDFEFSRLSMQEHWQAGYQDTLVTLKNPEIFERPKNREGVGIFDICKRLTQKI